MDRLLYIIGKTIIIVIQALPLRMVARLGRGGGAVAHLLDARHRRVARRNISRSFPEKTRHEVRRLVRENFRRIGEAYACGVKTASMSVEELRPHLELQVADRLRNPPREQTPQSVLVAIGHFGNFELYVHLSQFCPGYQGASTYRALRQDSLNRLMKMLRARSGCEFYERRFEGARLRAALNQGGLMLGLLADQDGGDRGLQLPFLGHNCSTSPAAALFALRYNCELYTAICHRVGLARWRIEGSERIPTHEQGRSRKPVAIMRDINAAFEAAVRRDPANWFWVHNRWKRGRPALETASSE